MRKPVYVLVLSAAVGAALVMEAQVAEARPAKGRQSMQQCVSRVLSNLARAGADESQVGAQVVDKCDAQLRATLAEAIQTGEAGSCTIESCIGMARERAAGEATAAYRQQRAR